MKSTDRVLPLLILSLGFTLACASPGDGPSPQGCSGDEQCSATARCIASACVENVPPTADFAVSGDLVASSEVTLDASASSEPDTGDAITSYKWEVSAGSSSTPDCQAPTIAGTDKIAHVIFACPGNWDVKLVAYDKKQAASAAVTKTVAIAQRTGPALVTAGPSQTFGHVCSGSPLKCTTTVAETDATPAAVHLAATVTSEASLTVRWSVQPPTNLALDDKRRVRFDPSETALSPTVTIETDGTAISGDWMFRIEALNGSTVVGSAATQVSVKNRPPVIPPVTIGKFNHTYNSATQTYTVSDRIPVQVTDPDGDALTQTVERHHTGDGESPFQVDYNGSEITFTIIVPGTNPLWLLGGSGLSRAIEMSATDSNGGYAATSLNIEVANRAPVQRAPSSGGGSHKYDSSRKEYVFTEVLGLYEDLDGDPLQAQFSTPVPDCTDWSWESRIGSIYYPGGLNLNLTCRKPFTSFGDLAAFIGTRSVQVTVADPWDNSATDSASFKIGNQPPKATAALNFSPAVSCTIGAIFGACPNVGTGPYPNKNVFDSKTSTFTLAPAIVDPDGDPLQVVPSASIPTAGTSGTNPTVQLTLPRTEYCGDTLPSTSIPFTVSDGVYTSNFTLPVQPVCQ